MDEPVWDATVFSKNRDRLLGADVVKLFFQSVLEDNQTHCSTTDPEALLARKAQTRKPS